MSKIVDDKEKVTFAALAVLKGFDDKVFIRNTERDNEQGWALKLAFPLQGLAILDEIRIEHLKEIISDD